MSRPARRALPTLALALAIAAAAGGCGQRGPLTLPDDARPIERLPQPPAPTAQEDDEEEPQNER